VGGSRKNWEKCRKGENREVVANFKSTSGGRDHVLSTNASRDAPRYPGGEATKNGCARVHQCRCIPSDFLAVGEPKRREEGEGIEEKRKREPLKVKTNGRRRRTGGKEVEAVGNARLRNSRRLSRKNLKGVDQEPSESPMDQKGKR